jgi:hypothetical protein
MEREMTKIPICPHCKCQGLVYTVVQVQASANIWYTADGKPDGDGLDIDTDKARIIAGGTVLRCSERNHIRRDIEMYDPNEKPDNSMFNKLLKPVAAGC